MSVLRWIVDARAVTPPVSDQGPSRGTCLAWAMTGAHEHEGPDPRSVEYLHWRSAAYPGGRGRPIAAATVLHLDGQPPDAQWRYDPDLDETSVSYRLPSGVTGPFARAEVRAVPLTFDALDVELKAGRWPVVALRVTPAFAAAAGGVVPSDGSGGGGHAVLAVGLAEYEGKAAVGSVKPGEHLVCVRNSWGNGWGVDGHALMTEAALAQCGLGSFVVEPSSAASARP